MNSSNEEVIYHERRKHHRENQKAGGQEEERRDHQADGREACGRGRYLRGSGIAGQHRR